MPLTMRRACIRTRHSAAPARDARRRPHATLGGGRILAALKKAGNGALLEAQGPVSGVHRIRAGRIGNLDCADLYKPERRQALRDALAVTIRST